MKGWCDVLFYGLSPDADIDENVGDRKTWPPTGSASIEIKDEMEALFTSATWIVKARVNGETLWESKGHDKPHGEAFVRQWARFVIRRYVGRLRELGVAVEDEYIKFGGKLEDL